MKLLIAIPTCVSYEGNPQTTNRNQAERRQACRETWLRQLPDGVEYRFFYGRGNSSLEADEVRLNDCGDGYDSLSTKFRSICRFALDSGFDWLLRVDDDAYVYPDRLLSSCFEAHDYSGYTIDYPKHLEWARYCSGAGFTLSRKAMQIIGDALVDHPADDLWTGRVLHRAGIPCHRDTRFLCGFEPHYIPLDCLPKFHPYTILHALTPEMIREVHSRGCPGLGPQEPPEKPMFEPEFVFNYGAKHPDCPCPHCKS